MPQLDPAARPQEPAPPPQAERRCHRRHLCLRGNVLILAVRPAFRGRRALLTDVSAGGMGLLLSEPLPVGADLALDLALVAGEAAAGRLAHVRHCRVRPVPCLFGIGAPHAYSTYLVFAGGGGLLVISPVLLAAAAGLGLLTRRYGREALVCIAVAIAFLVLDCGYFLAYGGFSPGPRFLAPALPFLAVGLAPAFARAPRMTAGLAAVSIVATTARLLTWNNPRPDQQTLWGDIARIPYGVASTAVRGDLPGSWLQRLGLGRRTGVAAR